MSPGSFCRVVSNPMAMTSSYSIFVARRASLFLFALWTLQVEAAVSYRFSTNTEESRPSRAEGTVFVDGSRWRIVYAPVPGQVTAQTVTIGTAGMPVIAVNDENQTWYRIPDWNGAPAGGSLFSFGKSLKISKLKVVPTVNGALTRVVFSYDFLTSYSGQKLRGAVWGEIRVRNGEAKYPVDLPWRPVNLTTGLEEVDQAFQAVLGPLAQSAVTLACEQYQTAEA